MGSIGIVTLYHDSTNYGGNLQAYALCAVLTKQGYKAEQICFSIHDVSLKDRFSVKSTKEVILSLLRRVKRFLKKPFLKKEAIHDNFSSIRRKSFYHFNHDLIPHSDKVYSQLDIAEALDIYDMFITGSDQVWNFAWYNPICFLNFVLVKIVDGNCTGCIALFQSLLHFFDAHSCNMTVSHHQIGFVGVAHVDSVRSVVKRHVMKLFFVPVT